MDAPIDETLAPIYAVIKEKLSPIYGLTKDLLKEHKYLCETCSEDYKCNVIRKAEELGLV